MTGCVLYVIIPTESVNESLWRTHPQSSTMDWELICINSRKNQEGQRARLNLQVKPTELIVTLMRKENGEGDKSEFPSLL